VIQIRLKFALIIILALALAGCGVLREAPVTPPPTSVVQITADQAAQAMDEDRFWSTYGHSALAIQGTLAALDQQPNDLTVTLATTRQTQVVCDLGRQSTALKAGQAVTVQVSDPENDVERQDGAVFIKNCHVAP